MFRSSPEHTIPYMFADGVFNQMSWSFYSEAPVRSTPLLVENDIYFGNADGKFFCINKVTHEKSWVFKAHKAIHSSAAYRDGIVYFSDTEQVLYAVNAHTGKQVWTFSFGKTLPYEWQFDYFLSSPTIYENILYIGGGDGNLYAIDCKSGKEIWKYFVKGRIRSTPAIGNHQIYFGDVYGKFHCLDMNGNLKWTYSTYGDTLNQANFGYDRKAIISSAVVKDENVIFGSRDGYLYNINGQTGEKKWMIDYGRSWVMSSPVIYKNTVIQGTSDGRFVNAINIATGKEVWRSRTNDVVFSSPIVAGDIVYTGSFDGVMYCMDAATGKKIVPGFMTNSNILSSPVCDGKQLFFGSDDGNLYALKTSPRPANPINTVDSNFVYLQLDPPYYSFKTGIDKTLAETLRRRGYTPCEDDTLLAGIMQRTIADKFKRRIVFATNYFPPMILDGHQSSLLRRFMDAGGEVLILHLNFAFFRKVPGGFRVNDMKKAGEILGIDFGYEDTRAFKGVYPSHATEEGIKIGLPRSGQLFGSVVSVKQSEVDLVYEINEIGEATSWSKLYANNGKFTQLWLDEFHHPEKMFEVIYRLLKN